MLPFMRPALLALLCSASLANAATGGAALTISQSGYLLDSSDAALEGAVALTFRVYDTASLGTLEWQGTCAGVPVQAGYYAVTLGGAGCAGTGGAGDSVLDTSDLPAGAARWLEVVVGTTVLTPRLALTSAPTAALASRALEADRLGGFAPSDFAPAAHAHLPSDVTGFDAAAVAAATASGSFALASHSHAVANGSTTGLLSAADWTTFNAKLSVESDPKIGTLTPGKWCTTDGTQILCTSAAPAGQGDLSVLAGLTRSCNTNTGTQTFDGSAWGLCIVTAGAFSLTAVPSAPRSSAVVSNTITPSGYLGTGTLVLSNPTGGTFTIVKNGTDTGLTTVGVTTSDTFALRTVTGSAYSTASSVTATLGTASATWTVTTVPEIWNCTTYPTHAGCVPGSQYATCKAIKQDAFFNGGNGTYYVDPDGASSTFSSMAVWCDMANGGWTLIQSHVAGGTTTQGATVGLAGGKYLPTATMQAFANASTSVRIALRSGATWVESADSYPITRLRSGLNCSDDSTKNASHFTGNGTSYLNYSCAGNASYPSVYWACGNGAGLHILYNGVDSTGHGFSNGSDDLDVLLK